MEGSPSNSDRLSQILQRIVKEEAWPTSQCTVRRNAHVYNCGDTGADLYLVESGRVKTVTNSLGGKKCLLSIYSTGDVFGELALLTNTREETAAAMTPLVLRRIPVARFRAALAHDDLLEALLKLLTVRLAEQQQVITNLVTMDSERRLAATLLTLANKFGTRQPRGICIEERITQEELSGMVGTTRSRVGLFLKRFSEAGLIRRESGAYLVVDESNLMQYLSVDLGV
ncbi:Crp/Fnr family transcriptional regulator [Streptomyces canus]|uniref:CRP/FNR family cyclic AMP-dependent transcriptional regulator n=1 Tax=Streptomyces canus TaxID=58343 RepID=A0AAW8FSR9_9ACTN|nr:Crp/Fnr family transcriptional regulator [Streptomyces canus]MDQ0758949.1 CRP/FNR family cyclic AMP-dependent transcriptional regulator [Streptomyces canus]MDQ0912435.1 CRP/FNR family cyclic AMP-dependent transcriptional regulator [Streptomyces canus]MDQ1072422.1 CRP/FNR family cyclic AMP-dependent transcriptional regulator [Streptomyces canus]